MQEEAKQQPISGGQYLTNRLGILEGVVASLIDERNAETARANAAERERDELKAKVAELEKPPESTA